MIKPITKIFFFICFLTISTVGVYSQSLDTNTRVTIYSEQISADTIEFEIRALRLSDNFLTNWANATFMFRFDSDFDYNNLGVTNHPDQSGIPYLDPNDPSFNAYSNQIQIVDDRIAIGFRGPYIFDSTMFVPNGQTPVVLGRFHAYTLDGSPFPLGDNEDGVRFIWLRPANYYQDFAYKTDRDIDSLSVVGWYLIDDNISVVNNNETTVNFVDDGSDRPEMILDFFKARYAGGLKVFFDWATISEAFNRGFIIRRGIMPFNSDNPNDVVYNTEVANWNIPADAPFMTGMGTSQIGRAYHYEFDTVQTRNLTYCYELLYEDVNGEIISLAYSCLTVPNAVLTYLQANPNPATDLALVEYTVEDDVYLDANLYELTGKKVKNIYENKFVPKGTHTFTIDIPNTLASGVYEIVLEAIPINDNSVERSRGVFKLQVIR